MDTIAENKCFGGIQGVYCHASAATGTDMTFGLFLPDTAKDGPVPLLWFLSGLTCTHENAMTKAGAQGFAAEHGVALVFPDTSPRGDNVANDDAYDLGQGAGFYIDATEAPWSPNYNMERYILSDLSDVLFANFPLDTDRQSLTGHSMGGHGALTIALKNPHQFKSVSAFSPIVSPLNCPWGEKALGNYIGDDKTEWAQYDTCDLVSKAQTQIPILVDQGTADNFLEEQLKTDLLIEAAEQASYPMEIRYQDGYDHSYFFIASFIQEHLRFHAKHL